MAETISRPHEHAEPVQTRRRPETTQSQGGGGRAHGGKMIQSRGERGPLAVKSQRCKGSVTQERVKVAHRDIEINLVDRESDD